MKPLLIFHDRTKISTKSNENGGADTRLSKMMQIKRSEHSEFQLRRSCRGRDSFPFAFSSTRPLFTSPRLFSSPRLSFLPSSSLRGKQWRPLINFSRWLALFVRRYGIFPLRFSNRSSILNPSDSSVLLFLPNSLRLSFSDSSALPTATCFPLCTRTVCAWAVDSAARMGKNMREKEKGKEREEGGGRARECRKRRKRREWTFSIPGTLVGI